MEKTKQQIAERFRSIIIRANDGMKAINKKGDVIIEDVYEALGDIETDAAAASKMSEAFIPKV